MPCTRKKIARHIPDDLLTKLRERAPRVPGGRSTDDAIAICLRRYFELLEIGEREFVTESCVDSPLSRMALRDFTERNELSR